MSGYKLISLVFLVVAAFIGREAVALAPAVSRVEIERADPAERVIFHLSQPLSYKLLQLANPHRLVVDLPKVSYGVEAGLPRGYGGRLIKKIRFGQFNASTTRVVLDLNTSVKIAVDTLKESPGGQSYQLVLDLVATGAVPLGAAEPKPRQEERKPIIVIDAGHGGNDPGAIGNSGMFEKRLTFEYASALRHELLKTGRYDVVMTRDDDRFILLRERVNIARKVKGDLFISIHADSAPGHTARGLSIYTLSEVASDKEAEALAARENKVDYVYGMDLSHENEDVAGILLDLAQRETKNKSAEFATSLIDAFRSEAVVLLPNTHRFAGFAVLKGPDIPAVLIELGFLTNPKEEKLLKTRAHRERVLGGIVKGIDSYFKTHKKR